MKNKIWVIVSIILAVLIIFTLTGLSQHSAGLNRPKAQGAVSLANLLARALDFEAKADLVSAKAVYQKLVAEYPESAQVMDWQKKAEDINMKLLFSSVITPNSVVYEIRPGDTLTKIAGVFKTTTDLLIKSNNLPGDKIIPGRKIKVSTAVFNIFVDKSQNILILKNGEEAAKTYVVSTGKNNCTPVGSLKIVNKLVNPTWFKAGAVMAPGSAENILGTRWLGFDLAGYGIHGTIEPQYLGKQVTQGCVRMANNDVEELYTIIPLGTEVTIVD